jgi:DNA-directed RNA polymerase subunit M/transcription elongation factor TFIIS
LLKKKRTHGYDLKENQSGLHLTFPCSVYNTLNGGSRAVQDTPPGKLTTEEVAVIRCPDCAAELDVDEDEVEEGEILSCPECEAEMEVTQTHPVHVNVISDDDDDDDEEDEESDEDLAEKEDDDDDEDEAEEEEEEEE